MKINRRLNNCQQKFLDPKILPDIREDIEKYCSLLSVKELRIFRQLLYHSKRSPIFRTSQDTIARWCNASREYVNRVIGQFERDGIVKSWYHHKETSHYRMSSFFTPATITSIAYIWRALPLSLLLSFPASDAVYEKRSQYINNDSYLKNCSTVTTVLIESLSRGKDPQLTVTGNSSSSISSFKKGKQLMQADLSRLNFDYLKSIKPTLAGKVKLTVYPEDILRQADKQLQYSKKTIENKWGYFTQTCNILCRERGIELNWAEMYRLSTQFGIVVEPPFYDSSYICVNPSSRGETLSGNAKGGAYTGSYPRSVSLQEAIEHNKKPLEVSSSLLKDTTIHTQRIQKELEQLKATESVQYERRLSYAQSLLKACGRDPITGNSLESFNPKTAVSILAGGPIDDEYNEDIDTDPFGDHF